MENWVLEPTVLLMIAAFLAGLLDAIVGGGGLIQVPALFSAFPAASPASLFATNKLSSIFGTGLAARTYWKTAPVDLSLLLPATGAALAFGFLGAWAMSLVPPDVFRKILPFVLVLVVLHVFRHKNFGVEAARGFQGRAKVGAAAVLGAAIGFYDGFFGPGTGSFLVFVLVRVFGQDFLQASASAKIINVACNFAALVWFVPTTTPLWEIAGLMAVFNMLGAWLGARLAINEGAAFVRKAFLAAVLGLIAKTAWDAFGYLAK
jgi:uncharacterized membrane protein YfcA